MRPAPIPDDAVWDGARRLVMAAPNGSLTDPDVAPCEMVVDEVTVGEKRGLRYSARCILEDGDLEKLRDGAAVWVSFYGGVPPFCVDVAH